MTLHLAVVLLALARPQASAPAPAALVDCVDPFIGTAGTGHAFPGASLPFGMAQPSPDTRTEGWDACSGYHASHPTILGFSQTHLSGTGIGDLGDILIVPQTGALRTEPGTEEHPDQGYRCTFRRESEQASPGYYHVSLTQPAVGVELTATRRCAMHRYNFAKGENARLLFDLGHGIQDQTVEAEVVRRGDAEIAGRRRSKGWAENECIYFVARFSKPMTAWHAPSAGSRPVGAAEFGPAETVIVAVGVSYSSIENAQKNLDAEVRGFDFDAVRAGARAAWNEALSRVAVTGGSEAERKVFATALYHSMLAPCLFSDADAPEDFHVFSLWDTFRALHPLLSLAAPERNSAFVASMLRWAEKHGRLPMWTLAGCETDCMIGTPAVPVVVDAYLKGDRSFDGAAALRRLRAESAMERAGLPAYRDHGAVAADEENESVSKTLEYAIADACIARLARALDAEDAAAGTPATNRKATQAAADEFERRSKAWMHLFDPATGFLRAKRDLRFVEPFDPREVSGAYTEANAWQYLFCVPHDVKGLAEMMGGEDAFRAKLDALFDQPSALTGRDQPDITGLIGQYAHGNEPCHHVAFLDAYVGRPWRVAEHVAKIRTLYGAGRDGLPGNDDCGQMSAWYVLASLGLYQPNPADPTWLIGTPLFHEATLRLPGGKTFIIRAEGVSPAAIYVQSASWNGKPLERCALAHAEIMLGGELVLRMGAKPSNWATRPDARPVSSVEKKVTPNPYLKSGDRIFSGKTRLEFADAAPGAVVYYTVDGSEPTRASERVLNAVDVRTSLPLRVRAFAPGCEPSFTERLQMIALPAGRSVRTNPAPRPQYQGGGPNALIDQLLGTSDSFARWQGFEGSDVEITLDLGEPKAITQLFLGALHQPRAWIFLPARVEFELSMDGREFVSLGAAAAPALPAGDGGRVEFTTAGEGRYARVIRIRAQSRHVCPEGHPGAGKPCWTFLDEAGEK